MTDEQRELLIKLCVNEEKIRKGELVDWQIEILNQYNYARDYLNRKYPNHTFRIVDGQHKNHEQSYTSFTFIDEEENRYYDMRIDRKEVDKDTGSEKVYTGIDNYYGMLLQKQYEKEFLNEIKKVCKQCVAVDACMTSMRGEELNESFDIRRIIDDHFEVTHNTTIYIDGRKENKPERLIGKVKKRINEKKIYGTYDIYILSSLPQEEEDYRKFIDQSIWERGIDTIMIKESFTQFNEEMER
ncbi:hypothetical protein [Anaerosporobacter faecicola]|uniref:hypothetical protein n=1 Tax=Anaerosporobacter faecicola TaxID=2718714 RepID=UPI00143A1C24|nr:hypothetical protein [Anaerosporobacter faecicola]